MSRTSATLMALLLFMAGCKPGKSEQPRDPDVAPSCPVETPALKSSPPDATGSDQSGVEMTFCRVTGCQACEWLTDGAYHSMPVEPRLEWTGPDTLVVEQCVENMCGDEMHGGEFRLEGDELVLIERVRHCSSSPDLMCARCTNHQLLRWELTGIEKKDYAVSHVQAPPGPDGAPASKHCEQKSLCPGARALISEIEIDGDLQPDHVDRKLHLIVQKWHFCHLAALKADHSIAGEVRLELSIDPAANAKVTSLDSVTIDDETMLECVREAVEKGWSYLAPGGGEDAVITLVLRFGLGLQSMQSFTTKS